MAAAGRGAPPLHERFVPKLVFVVLLLLAARRVEALPET